jgi:hypothetical protein
MSNSCPFPIFTTLGFLTLNQSQKLKYQSAWNDYNRIQEFNSNVSTLRVLSNDNTLLYYTFVSYAEKDSFRQGQFLHQQIYKTSNWNSVEQN